MSFIAVGTGVAVSVGSGLIMGAINGDGSSAGGGGVGGAIAQLMQGQSDAQTVEDYKKKAQQAADLLKGGYDQQLSAFQDAAKKLQQLYAGQYQGNTDDLMQAFSVYKAGKEAGLQQFAGDTSQADQVFGDTMKQLGVDYGGAMTDLGTQNADTIRGAYTDANTLSNDATGRAVDRLGNYVDAGQEALGREKQIAGQNPANLTDDQQYQLDQDRGGWLRTLAGSELRGAGRGGVGTVMKAESDERARMAGENRTRGDAANTALFNAGTGATTATNAADVNNANLTGGRVVTGEGTIANNQMNLGKAGADAVLAGSQAGAKQDLTGDYTRANTGLATNNAITTADQKTWLDKMGLRNLYATQSGQLIGAEGTAIGDTAMGKAGADADAQTSYANLFAKQQFNQNAGRGQALGWLSPAIGSGLKGAFSGSGGSNSTKIEGDYVDPSQYVLPDPTVSSPVYSNQGWGEG